MHYLHDLLVNYICDGIFRDEISGCGEKAYDYLSINDARQMLLFSSDQELLEYVEEVSSIEFSIPFAFFSSNGRFYLTWGSRVKMTLVIVSW